MSYVDAPNCLVRLMTFLMSHEVNDCKSINYYSTSVFKISIAKNILKPTSAEPWKAIIRSGIVSLPQTKERALKFEKFVEENEVKRQRALKKYQLEKKENELKEEEKSKLYEELEQLQIR